MNHVACLVLKRKVYQQNIKEELNVISGGDFHRNEFLKKWKNKERFLEIIFFTLPEYDIETYFGLEIGSSWNWSFIQSVSYNILLWYCLVEICDDIFYHPWNEYLILKKTTFTLFISRFCHLLSRNKIVKISISFIIFQNKHGVAVYGHIMLKTPVLVRSLKLSNIEPC